MINKKILIMKFRDFGINYDMKIKPEYIDFMEKQLNAEGFTDDDFVESIDKIMETNATMYGHMPTLGMFMEARPYRRIEPKYFIAHERKEETEEEKEEMVGKLQKLRKGLSKQLTEG